MFRVSIVYAHAINNNSLIQRELIRHNHAFKFENIDHFTIQIAEISHCLLLSRIMKFNNFCIKYQRNNRLQSNKRLNN